jgi:hypothetical protein
LIYEYRVYEAAPGRLDDVVAEVRDCVKGLLEKHGATSIGHWTSEAGDYSDRLIYIIAFEDMAQRQKAWDGFRADPEWRKVYKASLAKGAPVVRVTNTVLNPTDYSPLQ